MTDYIPMTRLLKAHLVATIEEWDFGPITDEICARIDAWAAATPALDDAAIQDLFETVDGTVAEYLCEDPETIYALRCAAEVQVEAWLDYVQVVLDLGALDRKEGSHE